MKYVVDTWYVGRRGRAFFLGTPRGARPGAPLPGNCARYQGFP